MKYILKNKDIDILEFEVTTIKEEISNTSTQIIQNLNLIKPNLLPRGITDNDDLQNELDSWIRYRKIPKNRQFVENIVATYSAEEKEMLMDYIDVSLGLSLNDSYWITPANKEYKWKDYNLYDNEFSEALQRASFGEEIKGIKGITSSPEYTTNGMLKKCWHRESDGKIYLYKGSSQEYANGGKEAYSEYYMAQVAKVLGFDCVPYDLKEFHNQIVSSCPIFTNENEGFVPIYQFIKNDLRPHPLPMELANAMAKYYTLEKLQDLLVFDAIIINKDRHQNNFGMIVDNNTGKILRPAPIFDNGFSMINFLIADELKDIENSKMDKISKMDLSFDQQLKIFVQDRHASALEKLQSFTFTRHPKYNLGEEWLQPIEKYINKRATMALEFINEKTKENHQDLEETKTRHRKRKGR